MDLKGILSIAGYPGLFQLIKHSKSSIIVESLETKKRMPAYATSKISALEDIAMYTDQDEVHLSVILKSIFDKEEGKECSVNPKGKPEDLKKYMLEILPNYDKEKVYVSDIKRLLTWYNLLQKLELLKFDDEEIKAGDIEVIENKEVESTEVEN